MKLGFFLMLATFFTVNPGWAKVRLSRTVPVKMQIPREKGQWQNLNLIVPSDIGSMDAADRRDVGVVASKFGDKAIQNWANSPEFRNSSVGRTATTVEKNLKTEVSVPSKSKKGVDHKVSFQVLALQTTAKMEYKGWTNASVNYDAGKRASKVEVSEKFLRNKDVTLSHTASTKEDVSAVGVRWNW